MYVSSCAAPATTRRKAKREKKNGKKISFFSTSARCGQGGGAPTHSESEQQARLAHTRVALRTRSAAATRRRTRCATHDQEQFEQVVVCAQLVSPTLHHSRGRNSHSGFIVDELGCAPTAAKNSSHLFFWRNVVPRTADLRPPSESANGRKGARAVQHQHFGTVAAQRRDQTGANFLRQSRERRRVLSALVCWRR